MIGSYEILNGLVQFRNGVTTTEIIDGQDVTVIDGGKILTGSIDAKKITVPDLRALNATIGGFHIGKSSIYSGAKQTVDSTERGIYFDSTGQSYFGDDKNFIRFYQSDNNNYKLQISADSLTFGSGMSVEQTFENIKGDIQNAQNSADNAQTAADKAKADAATALSTADTAKINADAAQAAVEDAAKTATDFIASQSTTLTDDGIKVFPKAEKDNPQNYTQINQQGMQIYKGGQKTASFGSEKISLGENSEQSVLEMCGGLASLSSEVKVDDWGGKMGYILLAPTEHAQSKDYPFRLGIASGKRDATIYLSDGEFEIGNYLTPRAASINYIQSVISGLSVFDLNEEYPEDGPQAYTSIGIYAGMGLTDTSTPAAGIDLSARLENGKVLNSLELFADNITINGSALADYVVERGTWGNYEYEKWNSGICECWTKRYQNTGALTMSASGNLYLSDTVQLSFPTYLFSNLNNINITFGFSSAGTYLCAAMYSEITNANKLPVRILKGGKSTSAVGLVIRAKGRWK